MMISYRYRLFFTALMVLCFIVGTSGYRSYESRGKADDVDSEAAAPDAAESEGEPAEASSAAESELMPKGNLDTLTDSELREILSQQEQSDGSSPTNEDEPLPREQMIDLIRQHRSVARRTAAQGHTVRVEHCISQSYGELMEHFNKSLQARFQDLEVKSKHYDIGPVKSLAAQASIYLFFICLLSMLVGRWFLPEPLKAWVSNHRWYMFGAAFVFNMGAGHLMQSGAFEVYVDNVLVFSKLSSKVANGPSLPALVELVEAAIKKAASSPSP